MVGDARSISLKVVGEGGSATSRQAENLGLIVTELVMNALKHAFPDDKIEGQVTVAYDTIGTNWTLSVSDNGIGKPDGVVAQEKSGSARASSRRFRISSMPRLKLGPALRACRSLIKKKVSRRRSGPAYHRPEACLACRSAAVGRAVRTDPPSARNNRDSSKASCRRR